MNIVIIEDETSVAQNLSDLLYEINPEIRILVVLETVKASIKWFEQNQAPDIALFDIKIADGSSFEILEKVPLNFPIIFTTAYDEYALKAFKYNSIDYLLKPINKSDLEKAISKFKNLYTRDKAILHNNSKLLKAITEINCSDQIKKYKKSFLVNYRDQLIPLETSEIAYFYLENHITYCVTLYHKMYQVSSSLEKIQSQLDPSFFFRVNRQFIVSKPAIKSVQVCTNRKLKLAVIPEHSSNITISKLKGSTFKKWMKL
ncbi:LytTR family DNA-binding domain-containing protein [Flavobacteriaceae bacterium S356]|uniref:LytTR family DNA-binding domain-containing protein n=1 Tax=Asprobacillus argus TaxID=3076534 RepID=A0ABU3LES5_9FLAO|nr:LytTR family DNA-binding domain-containing protein [Flavobacteriaceae bacterium S356]